MRFTSTLRTAAVSALLAAACVAAATPAFADPGYTQDNRVSLMLRNESGCTATVAFYRAAKREFTVTIDNNRAWQAYNVGEYHLGGTVQCGTNTASIVLRYVNLSKTTPQTFTIKRNAAGQVIYQ